MAETKHDNLPFGVYFNVWSLYMHDPVFFIKLLLINIEEQKKVDEEQF